MLHAKAAVLTVGANDRVVTVSKGLEGRRLSAVEPETLTDALVAASVGLTFSASASVLDVDGEPIGTLCVLDDRPRALNDEERRTLDDSEKGLVAMKGNFYENERVALFIDGANLYSAARALGFDIDYRRLL